MVISCVPLRNSVEAIGGGAVAGAADVQEDDHASGGARELHVRSPAFDIHKLMYAS